LTKMEFIISARQFLCLPPLKIPNAESQTPTLHLQIAWRNVQQR
jgi:hypothetical protein